MPQPKVFTFSQTSIYKSKTSPSNDLDWGEYLSYPTVRLITKFQLRYNQIAKECQYNIALHKEKELL